MEVSVRSVRLGLIRGVKGIGGCILRLRRKSSQESEGLRRGLDECGITLLYLSLMPVVDPIQRGYVCNVRYEEVSCVKLVLSFSK